MRLKEVMLSVMSEIKSLADRLRNSLQPETASDKSVARIKKPADEKHKSTGAKPKILNALLAYDTTDHKTMVHARFDAKTAKLLGQFKMATGVENTRLCAFAVHYLFETHPELKTIIKDYIQNLEL